MRKGNISLGLVALLAIACAAGGAWGAEPKPWQWDLQPAASSTMDDIREFNVLISVIIVAISAFVLGLLGVVIYRFNASRSATPSRTSHNSVVEVIWTVVPIMILVVIAVPSFKLLYFIDRTPNPEMTLRAIGHQWYWSYEYPDHGELAFDALMIEEANLKPGQRRLLETDNRVVLPVDTDIRILTTADDVLHSWAVPAFGVKLDAIPGRVNETWVRIESEGVYYGQCSELCGTNHAFMPITVEAVSKEEFQRWVAEAKERFAGDRGGGSPQIAASEPANRSQ